MSMTKEMTKKVLSDFNEEIKWAKAQKEKYESVYAKKANNRNTFLEDIFLSNARLVTWKWVVRKGDYSDSVRLEYNGTFANYPPLGSYSRSHSFYENKEYIASANVQKTKIGFCVQITRTSGKGKSFMRFIQQHNLQIDT